MFTQTIHKQISRNNKLISAIESVSGWFIEWNTDNIKLSADTQNRLDDLVEFFRMFTEENQ